MSGYFLIFRMWRSQVIKGGKHLPTPPFKREKGIPTSCNSYLHPKDPLYRDNPDITLNISNEFIASFNFHPPILITEHALTNYISRQTNKRKIRDPDINTKRGALMKLYNELRLANPAERKNSIRQIIEHDFKESEYLVFEKWVYVIEKNGKDRVLVTCYPIEGKEHLYKPIC